MITVVCIYSKNSLIGKIAHDFASQGAELHLWALDEILPSVAQWTRGVGRGDKTENLNKLVPFFRNEERVLFTDDDIEFPPGFLKQFLDVVDRFGLQLAQPALSHDSLHTFPQTLVRSDILARETNWVEQMVYVMGHEMIQQVMPVPQDFWMGWGYEMVWEQTLRANGWKAGIVDGIPIHHKSRAMFTSYDPREALGRMQIALKKRGLSWKPMRTLRAFSESGECDWVGANAARFVETTTETVDGGQARDRILDSFPPPLRPYWRRLQQMYGEARSALKDDAEIRALFEGQATQQERERFLIESASLLQEQGVNARW